MKKPFIQSEVVLGAWSRRVESSQGTTDGWLKLYLPDDSCLDILSRLPDEDLRGQRKSGGKLFILKLIEYDIAESISDMPIEIPPEPAKPSTLAALICKEPLFKEFSLLIFGVAIKMMQQDNKWDFADTMENKLASLVRFLCSIESRSELDKNKAASDLFFSMIYKPYNLFKAQKNEANQINKTT